MPLCHGSVTGAVVKSLHCFSVREISKPYPVIAGKYM